MSRAGTVILALLAFGAGMLSGPHRCGQPEVRTLAVHDTVVRVDTVRIIAPAPVRTRPLAAVRAPMVRADTVRDTVVVEVPVTTVEYSGEGYRAYLSGWQPRLDSLVLLRPVTTVRSQVTEPRRRWGVGVQAGVGITPRGVQPYLGVGIYFGL